MSIKNPLEFFIQLHLTERCNLKCTHCYQSGEISDEMSLAEIRSVISEVSDMLREWSAAYEVTFSSSFNITVSFFSCIPQLLFQGHSPSVAFYLRFLSYLRKHNQPYAFPFLLGSFFLR